MRRTMTAGAATLAMLIAGAGGVLAHPMDPGGADGQGEGVGVVPAAGPGHSGIDCAAEAGSPTFPLTAEEIGLPVACPAGPLED